MSKMIWPFLLFLASTTRAFVMVKIHQNAFFKPQSPCAFIDNITILNDGSIQSCISECVHYEFCQTAVYYDGSKVCSIFDEHCENGEIKSAGSDPSSVICYRKTDHSSRKCSLTTTMDYEDRTTILDTTTHSESANLTLFTGISEDVYGIWNTTAGQDSTSATPWGGGGAISGYPIGTYPPGESPNHAFDGSVHTKYFSSGMVSNSNPDTIRGINTGFYITPKRGLLLLRAVQFYAADYINNRDPLTMTIEGTNHTSALTVGSSWTLIYSGSTGLITSTPRFGAGALIWLHNNSIWYSSYRLLITSKHGISFGVEYSEVKFFT